MNKFVKILVVAVMVPLAVIVPAVLVQTISSDSQVYAQQTTLQQRVEKYKTNLQTSPSKAELDKLKLRCTVSQNVLRNLATRVATVQDNRTKAYDSINKSLSTLTTVLKAKSIETTKLEEQSKALKVKTDQFAADLTAYRQAVNDAASVDCSTDPLALRASIEEARTYHTKLVSEVGDIRSDINNIVKPLLKQTKADLETQQKAATQPATDGGVDGTQ